MNSRKTIDEMFDLALRHDLKIWLDKNSLDCWGKLTANLCAGGEDDDSYSIGVEDDDISYVKHKLRKMKIEQL